MTTENFQEKEPEAAAVYRTVPEGRLIWRHWEEDQARTEAEPLWLVYDCVSDDTHLLNPLAVAILRLLEKTPSTAEEVLEKLAAQGMPEEEIPELKEIRNFLGTLEWRGLLETM